MANALFNTLKRVSENKMAFTIDEENPYEVKNWIDTGCYALNAILSDGDIFKGIPDGKRIMISGESGVAKSLFMAIMVKAYLDQVENSTCIFFESEASTVIEMAKSIGIADDKILIVPVQTVEEFRTQAVRMLDKIIEVNEKVKKANLVILAENKKKKNADNQKPLKPLHKPIFILDSLGNLGTLAESEIILTDKRGKGNKSQTRDMTRAQLIRGMARTISLKIAMAQIPLIFTNHTYKVMAEYTPDETSGGGGTKYMCDISLILTKAKEKDASKKQSGIIITMTVRKSRYMKENKTVKILISFARGMYRFSDIVNKATDLEVLKKADNQNYCFPPEYDKTAKVKMKEVRMHASKYFTGDLLNATRDAIKADFSFGIEDGKFELFDDMEDLKDVDAAEEEIDGLLEEFTETPVSAGDDKEQVSD